MNHYKDYHYIFKKHKDSVMYKYFHNSVSIMVKCSMLYEVELIFLMVLVNLSFFADDDIFLQKKKRFLSDNKNMTLLTHGYIILTK